MDVRAGPVAIPSLAERQPTRIQARNREIILEAALPVFSAFGFRGSTLDRIAERAGMSKPNLLYYFRRKGDIYAAVLERTLAEWLAPLEAIDPAGDPPAELARYVRAKLRMAAERPDASRLFAGEILNGAPVIGPKLAGGLRRLVDQKAAVVRRWIEAGRVAPVDSVHLLFTIWAVTQHYADFDAQIRAITGCGMERPDFAEGAAKSVLAIVLDGVRPR